MATVAGTGTAGYGRHAIEGKTGDAGPPLSYPTGLARRRRPATLSSPIPTNSRVRESSAACDSIGNGRVSSVGLDLHVAGTGRLGFSGENGDARQADLYFPYGVALEYRAAPNPVHHRQFNNRIRRISAGQTNPKAPT